MGVIKRLGVFLLPALFFSFPLSASTVSILVVETGLQDGSNAGQYASVWEDSLMRVFFDAGHIVTNGSIVRLGTTPSKALPDELERDFDDAVQGGADYFVLAFVHFDYVGGRFCPQEVSLRMFSTNSRGMLYQNTLPATTRTGINDEMARANEAARMIIPYIRER